jgi:L-asparagine transporter-like permease
MAKFTWFAYGFSFPNQTLMNAVLGILFPREYRNIPARRWWLNGLRAVHLLCLCVVFGALYFDQSQQQFESWLIGLVLSGIGLFLLDLYRSCMVLFEARGIAVIVKLLCLLWLLMIAPEQRIWLLTAVVVFSAFVTHSPRSLRHRNLLPQRWRSRLEVGS